VQDNQRRFLLFNKAALRALECLDPKMTVGVNCIVVANDWHTAILPVLIKVPPPPPHAHSGSTSMYGQSSELKTT